MSQTSSVMLLLWTLTLGACATAPPAGPSVLVVPPEGKDLAQFQQEDATCRGYATQQIGYGSPQQAAHGSGIGSAAVGTVVGVAAGVSLGAAADDAETGAAVGGRTGQLVGSAAVANTASAVALQQGYDIAYAQCMAASGDHVQGYPVAWLYGPYGYPYTYPAYYSPWFGPAVTLGFFGRAGPSFHHGSFNHGFHAG